MSSLASPPHPVEQPPRPAPSAEPHPALSVPAARVGVRALLSSRLFWAVLALKAIAGCLFASDYLIKLFVPFVTFFARHPLENPYAHFWQAGETRAFPYPALMLDIVAAPILPLAPFLDHLPVAVAVALLRLPLLLADIVIMAVLVRWLGTRLRQLLLLYWCSPVLFYISYVHGQFDAIPLAILFVSLFLLFKGRFLWSAALLGLAIATKTHLVAAIPFFLIYVYRHDQKLREMAVALAILALAFTVPNLPYAADGAIYRMVFDNPEQQKLTLAALDFDGTTAFYIIPAFYIALIFFASNLLIQSRDLFLVFLGCSFGLIIFFVTPMQGWYFWIIPFFAYFFGRMPRKVVMFVLLQAAYFVFFGVTPTSDYWQVWQMMMPGMAAAPNINARLSAAGVDTRVVLSGAFTLMQTLLLLNCLWIYRRGVRGLQKRRLISSSFLLGIGGDSGSGKSTLAEDLLTLFTPRFAGVICGDDMHKWQRGHEQWKKLTHLDPRANELHRELHYLMHLQARRKILRRHYDHSTGKFTDERAVRSQPLIIYEGLHSFYLKPAQQLFDLKVFIEPQHELLLHRKIQRDMRKRNYSREQAIAVIEQRAADRQKYITTQENNADVVVSFRLAPEFQNVALEDLPESPATYLELRASNRFDLEPLLDSLDQALGEHATHSYDVNDRQVLRLFATLPHDKIEFLGQSLIPGFQDVGIYEPEWRDGWNGLIQLFVAYCLFHEVNSAASA